jgi:hypothetical protein
MMDQKGAPNGVLPSFILLYADEPGFELRSALDRVRANKSVTYTEVLANAVTCECFQRVRVPALLAYNCDGAETAAAVGTSSIIAFIDQQF